jgi:hypothetical protein
VALFCGTVGQAVEVSYSACPILSLGGATKSARVLLRTRFSATMWSVANLPGALACLSKTELPAEK